MKYIMAFDAGTTSARTIIFDKKGNPVSVAQKDLIKHFPKPGYVEEEPDDLCPSKLVQQWKPCPGRKSTPRT